MDLLLDVDTSLGKRRGIEAALRDAIRSGRLGLGTPLPSSRAMAAELGVARGTVVEAYQQLTAEGYLAAQPGGRTVVAHVPPAPAARPQPVATPGRVAVELRPGQPDPTSFPATSWLSALRKVVAAGPPGGLEYGDPRGRAELRSALAGYLARARGVHADPDRMVICSGWGQGLWAVAQAVAGTSGNRRVALEDPCYWMYRQHLTAVGFEVVAAPVDDRGVDPGGIDDAGILAITPAHQFPLGMTLAPERRAAVLAWAKATGAVVVEDDYDGEFRFDRQPVGALQGLDPDRVVYVGSTSKTVAPGLRLGWLVLPPSLLDSVVAMLEPYVSAPVLDQLALAELIASHAYDRHLRRMRREYRHRRDRFVAALAARAPAMRVEGIAAGLHALVVPPPGLTEAELLDRAARRGISVDGLGPYWHDRPRAEGLVVGFARPPAHDFPRSLDAVVDILT